jgi:uncharacterized membrane protein YgdD (TMEM256/DUF423 family)
MKPRYILLAGLLLMLLAVALGAFGAHALKSIIGEAQLQTWKTASTYHFYHALGLIGLGIWAERQSLTKYISAAGMLFIGGILLFSGSLYLLAVTQVRWLGIITPLGGVLFLAGWISWMLALYRNNQASS